ncbi:efflux RND transporter permease subunit [Allofournierella massiliensis]|uniref:Efflux RND transporter permease subunit n=1 Tax=Allofournierella massiliensis TaxID=1650663 RepID=A0ABT7USN5_9FIRM|nr:efflux RND transporter permease subunit [Fournierella massiliensis]MDM8201903.1 efflux RND transporter permease subunit [Fournierella massiliensis]
MSKYCVKKPFTVVVAVIMVIVLGVISFTSMTTDLLPAMELPYVMVVTSYPGASPERVEAAVTAPLEAGLGTVSGVKNVTSTSSENVSMVALEFEQDTNMDSAMVALSTALDQIKGALPDTAQNPMLMQLSPDMLPVMIASVDMEDMDIYELTDFVDSDVIPGFERLDGVASVSGTGMVEKTLQVTLNQDKIDEVNTQVLASVDDKLADAKQELDDARQKVEDGRAELENGKTALEDKQAETASQLAEGSAQLDSAIAQAQALASQEAALTASKTALETEKKGYEDGAKQIADGLAQMDAGLAQMDDGIAKIDAAAAGIDQLLAMGLPEDTALSDLAAMLPTQELKDAVQALIDQGMTTLADLTAGKEQLLAQKDQLTAQRDELAAQREALAAQQTQLQQKMDERLPQIETELANLETELMAAKMMKEAAQEGLEKAQEAYKQLESGKISAAAGFGSGQAQLAAAEQSLAQAEEQMEQAQEQFEDARQQALEQADLSTLLTKDMVSGLVMAQNFSMPAGYIKEGDDSYILRVGDAFSDQESVENALLMHIDGVGDIRLKDVADIAMTDNSAESYARVNGNSAVVLTIQKGSTASTSEVSKEANRAIEQLQEKYPGLRITPLMDQGDYIQMTVSSVLSNLAWGGVLAVIVLAIFLKDFKPTLVVALSIPISLMFAVVLMYFSGVTLNMISLSGLALGVGMLVDNSIVVIENIYRMRSEGVPAAKAAVRGAKEVAGAIAASTLTTICVFLPIVFTEGITRQLFTDMGLTIAYSLVASLLVALTLVPALSSTLLKTASEKRHPWFESMVNGYARALRFCLRHKALPLGLAAVLLGVAVWQTARMGMEFMPSMGGNQVSATLTLPQDTKRQDAYEMADQAMETMLQVPGVETVGAMDGGSTASLLGMGGTGSGTVDSMSFYLLLSEEGAKNSQALADQMTQNVQEQLPGCELSVSTSNMDMSVLGGSGMEIVIQGRDLDTLQSISQDMMDLLGQVEGFTEISNGQEDGAPQIRVTVDKDKAMQYGLTVAQIYSELSAALTTETTSTTLTVGQDDYDVVIVDERDALTRENLLDYPFTVQVQGENGETEEETHTLGEFATVQTDASLASISRDNQQRYMTVTAVAEEGYNTTLLSRQVEQLLSDYQAPEGYTIQISGEVETIQNAMVDLVKMIALALVFIYLIMVAQFQSLLSPFIVMFTIPLAFTGGLLALWISGQQLSVIAMLGFLILAGVVVNNGIVFVDYANQLRLAGMEKRDALVLTGRRRIRPILMTALTTILAMSTMVFSQDMGAEMSRAMAIVTIGGLAYATLLTLFVVPVLYDLLFRKKLKKVDLGEEDEE